VTSEKDAPADAVVPPVNAVLQDGVGVGVGPVEPPPVVTLQASRTSRMGMMARRPVVRLLKEVSDVDAACITELAPFGQAAHVKRKVACLSCAFSIST
jgi:hypothetical protein